MSKTIIQVNDVTMSFRMNNDRILSLKEFVTTARVMAAQGAYA